MCTYTASDKGEICGHLPKQDELQRRKDAQCPILPPISPTPTNLTRHIYGEICPEMKQRIKRDRSRPGNNMETNDGNKRDIRIILKKL